MASRGGIAIFLTWSLLRIRYVMSSYVQELCGQVDDYPVFQSLTPWHGERATVPLQEDAPKNHACFAGQARFGETMKGVAGGGARDLEEGPRGGLNTPRKVHLADIG